MKLPKMAAALLAAALAVSAALPALAADQRAELELETSVRCTGEAADETLTVRLTALDDAPLPKGCEEEVTLEFPARDCRSAPDKTLSKTFAPIVYTVPGVYEYTVRQDAGGRSRADYDDTVFDLKVTVAWDDDGVLKVHEAVRREGEDEKTDLLFRNSYRGSDPLPPAVNPPSVTDKPTVKPVDTPTTTPPPAQPVEPPVETPEVTVVLPPAAAEPVAALIQTGQLFWPVPVLAGCGLGLLAVSLWLRRRRHGTNG